MIVDMNTDTTESLRNSSNHLTYDIFETEE